MPHVCRLASSQSFQLLAQDGEMGPASGLVRGDEPAICERQAEVILSGPDVAVFLSPGVHLPPSVCANSGCAAVSPRTGWSGRPGNFPARRGG